MMHYLIANAALAVGIGAMYVGHRWMDAALDKEEWVALSIQQIHRQERVLHEAIILHNYGADREAVELLEREGFRLEHG